MIVREGLVIFCVVVEQRKGKGYGRPQVKVTPMSGHGEAWVSDWQHRPDKTGLTEGPK